MTGFLPRLTAMAAVLAMVSAAPAQAAAQAQAQLVSPWAALSAVASPSSSAALCASSSSASASSTSQDTAPGCVLPLLDAPAAAPVATGAVPTAAPLAGAGFNVVPLLLGLAALAGLAALVLGGNSDDDVIVGRPISPP
jgi:hypothetical protein